MFEAVAASDAAKRIFGYVCRFAPKLGGSRAFSLKNLNLRKRKVYKRYESYKLGGLGTLKQSFIMNRNYQRQYHSVCPKRAR